MRVKGTTRTCSNAGRPPPRIGGSDGTGRKDRRPRAMSSRGAQCRKWRTPVNTIAMPRSFAAAITSSSRIEPPG